jgi:hypothetical protein
VKRLRAKAGFWTHFATYLAVNAFSRHDLVLHRGRLLLAHLPDRWLEDRGRGECLDAYGHEPLTEEQIQREMDHLRR